MKFKVDDYVKVIDQEIYGKVIFVHVYPYPNSDVAREVVIEDIGSEEFSAPYNQLSYRPSDLEKVEKGTWERRTKENT